MTYSNMWPRNEWALKHLNWAWVLYPLLAYIPFFIIMVILFSVAPDDTGSIAIVVLMSFALVSWQWYLSVWSLKHKGRSLWNLLYLLIPYIGGIIFLCISNKDQLAKETAEREEREKYQEKYWKQVEAKKQDKKYL